MLVFILVLVLFVVALYAPRFWASRALARHRQPREDLERTGGQFARHLLDGFELSEVEVETTQRGDHYDPLDKTVRLSERHYDKKSLTALVVAAHEVGHALQDAGGYEPLKARTRLALIGDVVQKVGVVAFVAAPFLALVLRVPRLGLVLGLIGLATMFSSVVVHFITLPVEWDASFRRALPLLAAGGFIPEEDMPAAREILTACALTYVAGSLASLLNLWRWLRFVRG